MENDRNLIGCKVYSVTSPSNSPRAGIAASEGFITAEETLQSESFYIVVWYRGELEGIEEPVAAHTVGAASNPRGVGVYFNDIEPVEDLSMLEYTPTYYR